MQQWYDDGMGYPGEWEELPAQDKVSYLANCAAAYDVSYDRFADAAARTLGLEPGQEFTADQARFVQHEFDQHREIYAQRRADRRRAVAMSREPAADQPGALEQGDGQERRRPADLPREARPSPEPAPSTQARINIDMDR